MTAAASGSATPELPVRACFHPPEGALRVDLSPEEISRALADPKGLVWVDIHADGRDEGELVLRDIFHFHPLTIDDCYNTLIDPPKVDDYGDYLFIIVHNVVYDAELQRLSTNELNLFVGANYVVSVHRSPVRAVEEVRRWALQETPVLQRGPGFLAHSLIDVVVDDLHPVVEAIDDQVAAVEERVIERPEQATLQEVLRLKRNAQRLRRSITPQRDVENRFARGEYPRLIPPEAIMYFRDIYDHTVRVAETIESVRDLADGALNTYLSSVNNRINEVMKTLAIVAVVFLPLTLIASIYGTNFEDTFPAYGWGPGFAGMMVTMVVIGVALLAFFRWRRWF
ncbi:MAG: magnesium/cobalt transporter CorA [Chloroflexi bacterium]|nr:magnesium/cobalt transporter CorA [Chloroflexota bacterium]